MPIRITLTGILDEQLWGADEAWRQGGPDAVRELVEEDLAAMLEDLPMTVEKVEPEPSSRRHQPPEEPKNPIRSALNPYGYDYFVSVTSISGPGGMVVVFADLGDFYTAYLTHDYQVVWVMNSGASEVDGCTEAANALHATTREANVKIKRGDKS